MNSIKTQEGKLKNKKVIVRVDFNVPLVNGEVSLDSDLRIQKSMKTINFLLEEGARVLLISHFGKDEEGTLLPVFNFLSKNMVLYFAKDLNEARELLEKEKLVLLENLRKNPGEKENDKSFAKEVSEVGDMYVNEAFSASHRKHASIVSIPKYLPSFSGFQLESEIEELSYFLKKPENQSMLIIGGSKFDTKLPLISKFLNLTDQIFVGGALANKFLKEMGYEIGHSYCDDSVVITHLLDHDKIMVPIDVVTEDGPKDVDEILPEDFIYDIGPKTVEKIKKEIEYGDVVLWNGPLGFYEKGYKDGSREILEEIARDSSHSVVGGGDTVTLVEEFNLQDEISFISTGGGAMLDFLTNGTLPGIEALN